MNLSMRSYAISIFAGAVVGIGIGMASDYATGIGDDLAHQAYYSIRPVIESKYKIENKYADKWVLTIESNKLRDCQLIEVQAFDSGPGKEIKRLFFERLDGKSPSGMAPGKFRSALYSVEAPQNTLKLYFLHSCDGRSVRTEVMPWTP